MSEVGQKLIESVKMADRMIQLENLCTELAEALKEMRDHYYTADSGIPLDRYQREDRRLMLIQVESALAKYNQMVKP